MTGVTAVQGSQVSATGGNDANNYTVKSGDTLWAIARAHGVSLAALERANPQIANPNVIFPNQQIHIPAGGGSGGGVSGVGGANPGSGTGNVAQIAEQYLGQNASSLKTNTRDDLPMNANVPSNICCANFVSAVLTEAGQLPSNLHTDSVAQLDKTLRARGWTEVPASQARPGDVVIMQGGGISHTEIVSGPNQMIGSNNANADGSQRITHNSLDYALSHGGKILRAPAGSESAAAPQTSAAAPAGTGTREQRIDQAMQYFQAQGWSHAQAAGIVANLDAESGMDAGIRQHGGGPGYGLAQWEGPRQRDFARWAGHDIHGSSFSEQLRFIQHELQTTESGAARALRGATDARSAGSIVSRLYERPADAAGEATRRGERAVGIANR
jgi:spore coat assembly protein SafA